MKKNTSLTKKDNKKQSDIFLAVISAIFFSKYVFETGIAVGEMFYRLMQ